MAQSNQALGRQPQQLTAHVNTRVAPTTRVLIEDVARREGLSIREIVESAVLEKWGKSANEVRA